MDVQKRAPHGAQPRRGRGGGGVARRLLAGAAVSGVVIGGINVAPTFASSVSSAAFSGGAGTVSVGGTLYAKQGATLTLSIERVVATALGASVGAVETNYFGSNLAAFMLAIFFIGLLSFGFRLEKTAYRYASVTLTIIVLIPRTNPAWIVALHRFIEVSVGIIVALIVVGLWPERSAIAAGE